MHQTMHSGQLCPLTSVRSQCVWTQEWSRPLRQHLRRTRLPRKSPGRTGRCYAKGNNTRSGHEDQNSKGPNVVTLDVVLRLIDSQFLPIALAVSLMAGYMLPQLALRADAANISRISTFIIFIISGLSMRRGEAMQAMRNQKAFLYGLTSILFITPVTGKILLQTGMQPIELMIGLAVFVCMPTSLSANIALSGEVGANTAMSTLLTTSSNVISIFTVPVMLSFVLSTSSAITFNVMALLRSLIHTVLLPLFMGACLRVIPQVRRAMDRNRKLVRNLSTLCLATVPFTQIGVAKACGYTQGLTMNVLLKVMAMIVATLSCIRALNITAVHILRLGWTQDDPRTIRRAVVLAASQKTLPIAVAVIMQLGTTLGERSGLAVLPCVLAHFSQIVMDSMLVSWWKDQDSK